MPVTLYSFRQNACVLALKYLISSWLNRVMEVLDFVGAKVVVYDIPDEFIGVHSARKRGEAICSGKNFQGSGVIVLPKKIDLSRTAIGGVDDNVSIPSTT